MSAISDACKALEMAKLEFAEAKSQITILKQQHEYDKMIIEQLQEELLARSRMVS